MGIPSFPITTNPSTAASLPLAALEEPVKQSGGCWTVLEGGSSIGLWKRSLSKGMRFNLISMRRVASRNLGSLKNLGCLGPSARSVN